MIKIGLMGAHSSGRSAAVHRLYCILEKQGLTVAIVDSASDGAYGRSHGKYSNAQKMIYHSQYINEHAAPQDVDIVICDKTIYDTLAYSSYYDNDSYQYANWTTVAYRMAMLHAKEYDLLYMFRPSDEFILLSSVLDGITNEFGSHQFNEFFDHTLRRAGAKFKEFISVGQILQDAIELKKTRLE